MAKANVIYYKTDGEKIFDNYSFTTSFEDAEILITQFAKTNPNGHYLLKKHCYRYEKDGVISTMIYVSNK